MRILAVLLMLMVMSGCATHLTEAGKRIRVVQDDDTTQTKDCEQLGRVKGVTGSFLTNGEYGVIYATKDARNRAGNIPLADTLVITGNEGSLFGGEVTGIAYNCLSPRAAPVGNSPPVTRKLHETTRKSGDAAPGKTYDELFEKAKKCQAKGGVWVNNACIIQIE